MTDLQEGINILREAILKLKIAISKEPGNIDLLKQKHALYFCIDVLSSYSKLEVN